MSLGTQEEKKETVVGQLSKILEGKKKEDDLLTILKSLIVKIDDLVYSVERIDKTIKALYSGGGGGQSGHFGPSSIIGGGLNKSNVPYHPAQVDPFLNHLTHPGTYSVTDAAGQAINTKASGTQLTSKNKGCVSTSADTSF